jgi:hypothetical protein
MKHPVAVVGHPRINTGFTTVPQLNNKKTPRHQRSVYDFAGSELLFHQVALAVPSPLEGLTAVFGMGTGGSPPPLPPTNFSGTAVPSQLHRGERRATLMR